MDPEQRYAANARTFDAWAKQGRGVTMAEGHAELVAYAFDQWGISADDRVVDVGCGVGTAMAEALARGAAAVAGIDVAPEMIALANARVPDGDFQVASADALPWSDDAFTKAISIESLYYHPDPVASLREMVRVTRSGGNVGTAIELYADNTGAHPWIEMMDVPMQLWSQAAWCEAFREAGLVDVTSARIVRSTPIPDREAFTPSASFPSWEHKATYLREGALWVQGTVASRAR